MIPGLTAKVLADPDNDLAANVEAFDASGDAVWHIDRHVIDVGESAPMIDACMAAVALAESWLAQAPRLRERGVLISRPYAILDDEWIAEATHAHVPPPHVYVCIARDPAAFAPVLREDCRGEVSSIGVADLDARLVSEGRLFRLPGAFDAEPGAWIVEPREHADRK